MVESSTLPDQEPVSVTGPINTWIVSGEETHKGRQAIDKVFDLAEPDIVFEAGEKAKFSPGEAVEQSKEIFRNRIKENHSRPLERQLTIFPSRRAIIAFLKRVVYFRCMKINSATPDVISADQRLSSRGSEEGFTLVDTLVGRELPPGIQAEQPKDAHIDRSTLLVDLRNGIRHLEFLVEQELRSIPSTRTRDIINDWLGAIGRGGFGFRTQATITGESLHRIRTEVENFRERVVIKDQVDCLRTLYKDNLENYFDIAVDSVAYRVRRLFNPQKYRAINGNLND